MTANEHAWDEDHLPRKCCSFQSFKDAEMSGSSDVEIWKTQALRLVQASLSAISPNFRMVMLARAGDRWRLVFVLESEDALDREEIQDVADEFEALQDGPTDFDVEVTLTAEPFPWPAPPAFVVYRRRE